MPFTILQNVPYHDPYFPIWETRPIPTANEFTPELYGFLVTRPVHELQKAFLNHFHRVIEVHRHHDFLLNFILCKDRILRFELIDHTRLCLVYREIKKLKKNGTFDPKKVKFCRNLSQITTNQVAALAKEAHRITTMINHGLRLHVWYLEHPSDHLYSHLIECLLSNLPATLSPFPEADKEYRERRRRELAQYQPDCDFDYFLYEHASHAA